MNCNICNSESTRIFKEIVLSKYEVQFYVCSSCGYLFSENPYWLNEAYESAITNSDTGILTRNIQLAKKTSSIINFMFNKNGRFLDFAGGYGMFTRIMRDYGFDFYWMDKYCENIFAKGFEHQNDKIKPYEIVTAFEVFEHLVNPLDEMKEITFCGDNIIFSTQLLPSPIPNPGKWWYYHFEHGQHISFYTHKSLELLAKKFNLHFISFKGIHFMTKEKINPFLLHFILSKPIQEITSVYRLKFKSKTESDSNYLKSKNFVK